MSQRYSRFRQLQQEMQPGTKSTDHHQLSISGVETSKQKLYEQQFEDNIGRYSNRLAQARHEGLVHRQQLVIDDLENGLAALQSQFNALKVSALYQDQGATQAAELRETKARLETELREKDQLRMQLAQAYQQLQQAENRIHTAELQARTRQVELEALEKRQSALLEENGRLALECDQLQNTSQRLAFELDELKSSQLGTEMIPLSAVMPGWIQTSVVNARQQIDKEYSKYLNSYAEKFQLRPTVLEQHQQEEQLDQQDNQALKYSEKEEVEQKEHDQLINIQKSKELIQHNGYDKDCIQQGEITSQDQLNIKQIEKFQQNEISSQNNEIQQVENTNIDQQNNSEQLQEQECQSDTNKKAGNQQEIEQQEGQQQTLDPQPNQLPIEQQHHDKMQKTYTNIQAIYANVNQDLVQKYNTHIGQYASSRNRDMTVTAAKRRYMNSRKYLNNQYDESIFKYVQDRHQLKKVENIKQINDALQIQAEHHDIHNEVQQPENETLDNDKKQTEKIEPIQGHDEYLNKSQHLDEMINEQEIHLADIQKKQQEINNLTDSVTQYRQQMINQETQELNEKQAIQQQTINQLELQYQQRIDNIKRSLRQRTLKRQINSVYQSQKKLINEQLGQLQSEYSQYLLNKKPIINNQHIPQVIQKPQDDGLQQQITDTQQEQINGNKNLQQDILERSQHLESMINEQEQSLERLRKSQTIISQLTEELTECKKRLLEVQSDIVLNKQGSNMHLENNPTLPATNTDATK